MENLPKKSPQKEVVKDYAGRGILRVLAGSKNYYMRFRFYEGKGWTPWRTTGTSDQAVATKIASDEYQRLRTRLSAADGKVDVSNFYDDFTFVGTAQRWLELYRRKAELKQAVSGRGRAASLTQYKTYKELVERYMSPFFKRKNVDTFNEENISEYIRWRQSYYTTGPGAEIDHLETMRNGKAYRHKVKHKPVELRSGELSLIKSVFAFASEEGLITAKQIPDIPKSSKNIKDIKRARHPAFSKDHWGIVEEKIDEYVAESHESFRMARTGFKYFMLIMAETGLRPGNEHASIRWRHVEFDTPDGHDQEIASIKVPEDTKTGERDIIVVPHGAKLLRELQSWTNFKGEEDPLFANQKTGEAIKRYSAAFKNFLIFAGIGMSVDDKIYAPYSLRHTYATRFRERGLQDHIIAKLMGHTDIDMISKHYGQDEISSHTGKIIETDKYRSGRKIVGKLAFDNAFLVDAVLSLPDPRSGDLQLEEDDGKGPRVIIR
jgi:integrase